jgi:phosphonopyruvate decarboxylase
MGHCSSIAAGIALADFQKAAAAATATAAAAAGEVAASTSFSNVVISGVRRPVVALDGDGAAIMHLGAMGVIGGVAAGAPSASNGTSQAISGGTNCANPLSTFRHIVLNNGAHDSVGGQPTVAQSSLRLPAVAEAAGYHVVPSVRPMASLAEEEAAVAAGVAQLMAAPGPAFLEVNVRTGNRADLGRPKTSPLQNRDAFMKFLQDK